MVVIAACGTSRPEVPQALGGDTTREVSGRNAFGFPAPGLTNAERRVFEIGDSFFTQNWVAAPASTDARDGLGPTFNAQACSSCHLRDGRGLPGETGEGQLGLLLRLSVPGVDEHGGPLPHPVYGAQLQDRSVIGVPAEGSLAIEYSPVAGTYADGVGFSLRSPTYAIGEPAFGPLGEEVMISPRLAPQMVGMGLLESIPETDLVARVDPDDADGDGISGRVNVVWNADTKQMDVGRFGWKANAPSVITQVAGAFAGDMGITSSIAPDDACTDAQTECATAPDGGNDGGAGPEVTDERLASVSFYSRTLAVPASRAGTDDARDGSVLFAKFGCSGCHTPTHVTGDADIDSLTNQTIHPYTDLLLHDMGEGLADGRPDFEASGSEWRTPPLWGLGLIDDVNGERFLLHDGRARNIEEATLWHGGEGAAAMERFRTASADDRAALVSFLEAL